MEEEKENFRRKLYQRMSARFINGLILLVPITITIWVVERILAFTEGFLGQYLPFYFPGMGMVTLFLIIYCVGWSSSYWVTKRLIGYGEQLLGRIPVVKFIYNSVKHLSTAVFESNSMFDQVVLVPYQGEKAIGFLMADVPEHLLKKLGGDYVCVFIPWSLNMTSGTTLFVKREDVTLLDINTESALQYTLTAGAVMPRQVPSAGVPRKKEH